MNASRLSVALLALVGCNADPKPAPRSSGPSGSSTVVEPTPPTEPGSAAGSATDDPWASKPKAADTPEARKQRAEAALVRVATIKPKIAALRELPFKHDVATGYQTADEFRAYVTTELAKDLPPARSADISAALTHIGLIPKVVDLTKVLEDTLATQVGAYYEPTKDKFFVVMVPDSEMMLDVMSSHELVHGLQHHHFQLDKLMAPGMYNNDAVSEDAATAVRFLVEGDATYSMLVYAVAEATKASKLDTKTSQLLRTQVDSLASMDVAGLKAQMSQQGAAFSSMDADMKASFDAIDSIPAAILVPMIGSYTKGALVAAVAFENGGWPALNALYANPPQSTEQVLHPATKLFPKRDLPVTVTFPTTKDSLVTDVMGELSWWVYFDQWAKTNAADAAAGWGGDLFSVTKRADGRLTASIATTWDTPADAKQFADAYAASLTARFPAGGTDTKAGVARPDGGKVFVRHTGNAVYIVDGADDAKALDELVKKTKFQKRTK